MSVARNFFKQVFRRFDYEEACHGAVCLEVSSVDTEVAAWHLAAPLDERLAVFAMEHFPYASLGSTHINQVLRNILGKAAVHDCPAATDPASRLSLVLVEAHDAALAGACRAGLRWEVLSSALAVEEQDGILCIQTALNDPANAVMLMHEMQIIKHMSCVRMRERNAAGEVILESVRSRLLAEGFHGADSPALHALLRFVIEPGAGGEHALVQPLVDFHQMLVNPRVRRLRESHFRVVLHVPSPPARLYLLKAAYGCPANLVRDGWIDYFGPGDVARLAGERLELCKAVEGLYYRFRAQYEAAGFWKHVRLGHRELHLLDINLGRVLLAKEGCSGTIEELHAIAGRFDARMRSSVEPAALADLALPELLPCPKEVQSSASQASTANARVPEYTAEGCVIQRPRECLQTVLPEAVQWVHVPDPSSYSLLQEKYRLLLALSLAATCFPLPGVTEMSVTCADKVPTVRAERLSCWYFHVVATRAWPSTGCY